VSVRHAALHLNAGRTNIYERIKDGTLHSAKVGARTVITTASIKKLLESRESTKTD
jgi:excisionase family DNA binding protein